jgi:hypothetical protein
VAEISFFKASARSITHWGDYGDILQHGMTMHSPRVGGRLALERTGPYIPPITFPGLSIVLTDAGRRLLESSGLTGFSFLPVEKKLIVELHWETCNFSAEEPADFPSSGEPEDYILGKPHSSTVAMAMGELWELVIPFNVEILRQAQLTIDLRTWDGADLLRGRDYGGTLFSQRAQDWFTERWGQYVMFDPFPAV